MLTDIRRQVDILKALVIHNLSGQMRTLNYGYVWLLLEPIIYIGFMRLARQALGNAFAPPDGMTPLTFYTLGIVPTFLSFDVINKVCTTAGAPSGLLMFPRVTPIDLALANGLSSFCTYFSLFWIFLIPVSIFEGSWPPSNVLGVMLVFIGLFLLSTAMGFVLSAAFRVFPMVMKFWSMALRVLRMISGAFFVITMIPVTAWPYLTWNPILHLSEMMKQSWFIGYTSPIASPLYVMEWTLGLLLLGLSLEKFMRRIPYA